MPLETLILRFGVAIVLGAVVGIGREVIGKEAGVRTDMLVSGGAALFTLAGLTLPSVVALSPEHLPDVIARNSGFISVIANVVVGIGFLGAGLIIRQGSHVRGVTTAASVWFVAAVGILSGLGLLAFAAIAACVMTLLLLFLRKVDFHTAFNAVRERGEGE